MSKTFKNALLINLVCLIVVASLVAISLPFLYKQQRNNIESEVKTSLSIFEISARKAVNSQNKAVLKELAEQLLSSPSINYVKVTDQSSQTLMTEAGQPRKNNHLVGDHANKLAKQFNNQTKPASQINPIAWVEIEFSAPTNILDWMHNYKAPLINLVTIMAFIQFVLIFFTVRIISGNPAKINSNQALPPVAKHEESAADTKLSQTNRLLKQKLAVAHEQHNKDQSKFKQMIGLSNRASGIKKALLEYANEAHYILDEKNHIIEASRLALNKLQLNNQQLGGVNLNDMYQPAPQQHNLTQPDFIELLVSYPETFSLLIEEKSSGERYFANHLTLTFSDDSLYLVTISPLPANDYSIESVKQQKHTIQLQDSQLYTPIKAACLEALHQLSLTQQLPKQLMRQGSRLDLDANFRLASLLKCLPWIDQQDNILNVNQYSPLAILETRLNGFSDLLLAKKITWSLVVNPEIAEGYWLNQAHFQALIDLNLYLISLYPSGSQVLIQLDLNQQQLQLNIDVEQANNLSTVQQSIIDCCQPLVALIGGSQTQNDDSLSITLPFDNNQGSTLLATCKPQAECVQVVANLANPFLQQCLQLQLQLFGCKMISLDTLELLDVNKAVWYFDEQNQLPDALSQLNIADLLTVQVLDQLPQDTQLTIGSSHCLRPLLTSYIVEQLSDTKRQTSTMLNKDIVELSMVSIAAEQDQSPQVRLNKGSVLLVDAPNSTPLLISDFIDNYSGEAFHCSLADLDETLNGLSHLDAVLISDSLISEPLFKQLSNTPLTPSLLIHAQQIENPVALPSTDLKHYQINHPIDDQQLLILSQLNQTNALPFSSLYQDEQLLTALSQSDETYNRFIELLTDNIDQPSTQIALPVNQGAQQQESYLKPLYTIFSQETKNRLSLINKQLETHSWADTQQHIKQIAISAEKFSDPELDKTLQQLLNASFNRDSSALDVSVNQLHSLLRA
ncbi:hypothetical protein ACVFI8_20990 [Agarivorans sp. MS3-6]